MGHIYRAGATAIRREALKTILGQGHIDVIKGNENEIKAVVGDSSSQQRGVDSSSTLTHEEKARMVRDLASGRKSVVVMTGASDFVSDGEVTVRIDNGHPYMAEITGSGCGLGTAISAAVAAFPGHELAATVAALLHFEIAAEIAASRDDVQGPGTFIPAFLDELYKIRQATARDDISWLQKAKVVEASPAEQ